MPEAEPKLRLYHRVLLHADQHTTGEGGRGPGFWRISIYNSMKERKPCILMHSGTQLDVLVLQLLEISPKDGKKEDVINKDR